VLSKEIAMRRTLSLVLLLLSLAAPLMRADQITLTNGDRLTGTIVKTDADAKTLLMETDLAGDVTVKWDSVTAIESSQPLHLTLSDGRVVVGRVTTSGGRLEVATANAGEVATPRESVKVIRNDKEQADYDRLQHPGLFDFWSGLFDMGLSVTEGNSATSALTIAGKASRVVPKSKLSFYYTRVYAKDNKQTPSLTTANATHGGARYEFNFKPKVYVFAFADFDSDELQNLNIRNVLGGGPGYHMIQTKKVQFDVFGGVSFDQEYFSAYTTANPTPPPATVAVAALSRHFAEIVSGESLSAKLGGRTTVTEQVSFFPNLSSTGNYRVTLDANAVTKIKTWLGWQTTFSDRYISDPPLGLKGNDLLLSTGLRLTFGKGIF
jgi:putative salt-induced outer membrane protein YdiY